MQKLFFPYSRTYRSGMTLPYAVLLDRDGVINFDSPDYILTPEQWQPIPGSLEAIARLTKAGIKLAIASNQSALGRGMLNQATFEKIHSTMLCAIEHAGGKVDHIAYCPHAPDDGCKCRKPLPGLPAECISALNCPSEQALMIGDSYRDIQAAHAAGINAMLVQSGYGDAELILQKSRDLVPDIQTYANLAAAVDAILGDT